jgi:hypothetical protein
VWIIEPSQAEKRKTRQRTLVADGAFCSSTFSTPTPDFVNDHTPLTAIVLSNILLSL